MTMSILSDVLSMVRAGKSATKDLDDVMRYRPRSIASKAQDATFMFPCLAVNTIPTMMLSTIIKNLDRIYAAFVQTAISADPLIDISIDHGPLDYMKRMHQNMKLESVIYENLIGEHENEIKEEKLFFENTIAKDLEVSGEALESTLRGAYNGEYRLFVDPSGTFAVAFSESVLSGLSASDKELMKEYMSDFDTTRFPVFEADSVTRADMMNALMDSSIRNASNKAQSELGRVQVNTPKLVERDVKMINDMQPYGVQVRLMAVNDKKEFVQFVDFIVGVKTILHPVKSNDIVDNLAYVLQNKNALFNFIRWRTGEISLVKDLIMHVSEAKYDASYKSRNASPFFPNLKKLKNQKLTVGLMNINKLVPNATIVISSFEVEELRTRFGMDIKDIRLAKKIISELFLMTLMIVDEGSETVEILYDSSSSFETYALETLEREMSLSSNKLGKEIGRMISQ